MKSCFEDMVIISSMRRLYKCSLCPQHFSVILYYMDLKTMLPLAKAVGAYCMCH